jgi:hypothetical protein
MNKHAANVLYFSAHCRLLWAVKGKDHPITGHEVLELNFFLSLGARWGWVVNTTPRPLYPREETEPVL